MAVSIGDEVVERAMLGAISRSEMMLRLRGQTPVLLKALWMVLGVNA
jgi:hypothetical protein